jgi:2-oxoglutarate/2-oxoacid ferredoxin oxidoreductase subunit beta
MLDFRSGRPIWCSYCGNYNLLTSIYIALASLDVDPKDAVVVSGIGCSSRMPGFVKSYGLHSVHGRALPIATGVKLANPALTVIAVMGDGDGLGIGGGHLMHAMRRNPDIACILVDNSLYGMTKGQPSPTTPHGVKTSTTPYGNPDMPLNPVHMAVSGGTSFVARGYTGEIETLQALIASAVSHRGFSLVHTIAPCPTFNYRETYKYYSKNVAPLPEDHDTADIAAALRLSRETEPLYTGVYYKEGRPTLDEFAAGAISAAGEGEIDGLIGRYR